MSNDATALSSSESRGGGDNDDIPQRRWTRRHLAMAAATHDNDKKYMASPATACNGYEELFDQCNDEGNGGGVYDKDNVLVGAKWQR